MNCEEAEKRIADAATGAPPDSELASHLEECAACRALNRQCIEAAKELGPAGVLVPPPDDLWGRIEASTHQHRRRSWRTALALAAALCVAFGLSLFFRTRSVAPSPDASSLTPAMERELWTRYEPPQLEETGNVEPLADEGLEKALADFAPASPRYTRKVLSDVWSKWPGKV